MTIHIKNNIDQLTDEERKKILSATWFSYVYGVGLLFLPNCTWDCTDTVSALKFLREHKIPERYK